MGEECEGDECLQEWQEEDARRVVEVEPGEQEEAQADYASQVRPGVSEEVMIWRVLVLVQWRPPG